MSDVANPLAEIVGPRNLFAGDAIPEEYTHDEALTATPQKPAYVGEAGDGRRGRGALEVRDRASCAGDSARFRLRLVGRGAAGRGRLADLVRADERGSGGRRRQPRRGGPARRDADRAGRRDRRGGPALHGVPGRALVEPRRQRRDERRRHARGQVRRDPQQRARPAGRAADRRDHPHRRQDVEDLHRLRPHPADHRLGGHARAGDRGDRQAGARGSTHSATVLAPFADFDQVMATVPKIISSGLGPTIVEYIDTC